MDIIKGVRLRSAGAKVFHTIALQQELQLYEKGDTHAEIARRINKAFENFLSTFCVSLLPALLLLLVNGLKKLTLEWRVIANEVKQSHEIAASLRPVHHAVQGCAPRNDYFIKPFTILGLKKNR